MAATAASTLGVSTALSAAHGPTTTLTSGQALAKLKEGNARFVANSNACATDLGKQRELLASGQAPWAIILTCADSRLAPELLFGGVGLGELFIARNAGNLADTAVLGTLEYGAAVLGAPLIVVLGHERCGAVAAACDIVAKNASYPGVIGKMVEPIVPVALSVRTDPGDFVDNTIRASARRTATALTASSSVLAGLVADHTLQIVSAYYDLNTGVVEYIG